VQPVGVRKNITGVNVSGLSNVYWGIKKN